MQPTPRLRSYLLVGVQFLCLGLLVASGPPPTAPAPLALLAAGLLLGLWAVAAMRLSRLSVLPDPRPDAELVVAGPYRLIRHPMYASLLLAGLGLVIAAPHPARWALWATLLLDLALKINYEERLLAARLPAYRDYQARTWRLLPFVW